MGFPQAGKKKFIEADTDYLYWQRVELAGEQKRNDLETASQWSRQINHSPALKSAWRAPLCYRQKPSKHQEILSHFLTCIGRNMEVTCACVL